jgi:hypothetical protein
MRARLGLEVLMKPTRTLLPVLGALSIVLTGGAAAEAVDWSAIIYSGGDVARTDPPAARRPGAGDLTGFRVGASLSASRGCLGIRGGLEFVEGTEISGNPETIQFDALQAPLLLEVRTPSVGAVRPTLLAGVAVSRILGARSGYPSTHAVDVNLVGTDVGAVLGGSLEIRRVGWEARYTWGLRDLVPQRTGTHSHVWSTGLRFRF